MYKQLQKLKVGPDLAGLANDALQAHERLHLNFKNARDSIDPEIYKKSVSTLENLQDIKASLDGSGVDFVYPKVDNSCFLPFKQLTLMHVPSSITQEVRENFGNLYFKHLKECVKRFCVLCW